MMHRAACLGILLSLLSACSSPARAPAAAAQPLTPQSACAGLSEEHRSFDLQVASSRQVTPRQGEYRAGKVTVPFTAGARIAIPASHGATEQGLQRAVECRKAELAARGYPEDGGPLAVEGADVDVQPHDDGFFLEITSANPESGKEVYRRARALVRLAPGEQGGEWWYAALRQTKAQGQG